jgi:hypothetical protein
MATPVIIKNGYGREGRLRVSEEGAAHVVQHTHPPLTEGILSIPYRDFFRDPSGSNAMDVNGSATPVEFSINAEQERDVYVKNVSLIIADAGSTLNDFGNLPALTNGVLFAWSNQQEGSVEIHEGIKTNFQFIRLALGNPSFGDATNAFRAPNVSGTSEAYIPVLDFSTIFGMPWGFRLRKGTTDKLTFTVRDNLSGLDQFDAIAYGIRV